MWYASVVFFNSRYVTRTNNKAAWSSYVLLFTVCFQCHSFSRLRFYPLAQFSFLHLNLWSWLTNLWFLVHGAHHFLLLIYNIILSFCFDRLRMVTCYAHLNVVQLWCTGILDSFFSFLFLFLTISIVYRVEIHIRSPLG